MERIQVRYGYEQPEETAKGTLFVYDSFECCVEEGEEEREQAALDGGLRLRHIQQLTDYAERRMFSRIVLYVPHEETLKRMGIRFPTPQYKREDALRDALERLSVSVRLDIDVWERKRKKYTPMDTALRYMGDHYKAPYFLGMSGAYANRFASYQPFEEWIRKIRLVVAETGPFEPHPLLHKHHNRWNLLEEQ